MGLLHRTLGLELFLVYPPQVPYRYTVSPDSHSQPLGPQEVDGVIRGDPKQESHQIAGVIIIDLFCTDVADARGCGFIRHPATGVTT